MPQESILFLKGPVLWLLKASSLGLLLVWHWTLCKLYTYMHPQITPWFENGIYELVSVSVLRAITMVMNSLLSFMVGMILPG